MSELRLFRFGKRNHICDLVHRGELCLNPATTYNDEKLSIGAFDPDELTFQQSLPERAAFEVFCGKTGKSKGKMNVAETGPLISTSETNYYIFCMTYTYFIEFYNEFNADTCLIIDDPDRFINQACKKIMEVLPGWHINAGTVRYRNTDSFHTMWPNYDDIFYGKDAEKFKHQHEIRIVCVPPSPTTILDRIIVNIGHLHGYTHITGIESPNQTIPSEHSNAHISPFKCFRIDT